jgi:hypothetical protein
MLIWIRKTAISLENLRICDLGAGTPREFADLSLQICGFDMWTSTPQKFADLRLRNEPNICGFAD